MTETWSTERLERVCGLVQKLYEVTDALDSEFGSENRRFTPDGHLIGSLGEILAAYAFDLRLYRSSVECHDACTADGKKVQIKLTGGTRSVALRNEPDFLIVLQLTDSRLVVIYNGPGAIAWKNCAKQGSNGQFSITLNKLHSLNQKVDSPLPQLREFPSIQRRSTLSL